MNERCVLNPHQFVPELPELDLDSLGLAVRAEGVDWGEASITPQMVKAAQGETSAAGHRAGVTIRIPIRVQEEGEVPLAEAANKLEAIVTGWQEEGGWILRDYDDGLGFAGALGYRIIRHTANLSGLHGWLMAHRRVAPDVVLTATRWPIGYSPEEYDMGTVTMAEGERELIIELDELGGGSVPGLIRYRFNNENETEHLRGLILATEWRDHPQDETADTTAALSYDAADLTLRGGSAIGGPAPEVRGVGAVRLESDAFPAAGLPAGTQVGDLLVMIAESGGPTANTEATNPLTAAGWSSPPAPYAPQVKGNTRLTVLYRIATGADPVLTNDTGDHQLARIIAIKAGTFDPVDPFNAIAVGTQAANKAVSIPGATTTRDNCLVIACATGNLPDALRFNEFSGETNASLTGLTEQVDNTDSVGDGGALFAATGVKAAAGAYGATTCTAVTSAERGVASLAINPVPTNLVKNAELTAGWQTILSSEVPGVGHMTHSGVRRLWLRAMDLGGEPGSVEYRLRWRPLGALTWSGAPPDNPIIPSPLAGDWAEIDLGEVRPQAPMLGEPRIEWELQARAPGGTGGVLLHKVRMYPTEQFVVLRAGLGTAPASAQTDAELPKASDETGFKVSWGNRSNITVADDSVAVAMFVHEVLVS